MNDSLESEARRPRVLMVCGYFDVFAGYNEVSIAKYMAKVTELTVFASDLASPIFSEQTLTANGVTRRYESGTSRQDEFRLVRFPTKEHGSVLWSTSMWRARKNQEFDLVVQMVPGQIVPLVGSFVTTRARFVVFPDNSAMWKHHSILGRAVRTLAFGMSKGLIYRYMIKKSDRTFGYTPDTLHRIRKYGYRQNMMLLPLTFDSADFSFKSELRAACREALGIQSDDVLIIAPGKLAKQKRLESLVEIFAKLHPRTKTKLLITGVDDGPYSDYFIREVVGPSPRCEDILLRPFVTKDELNALLNAADVGVWPFLPAITIQQSLGTGLRVAVPYGDTVSHLLSASDGTYFSTNVQNDLSRVLRILIGDTSPSLTERQRRAHEAMRFSSNSAIECLLRELGQNSGG